MTQNKCNEKISYSYEAYVNHRQYLNTLKNEFLERYLNPINNEKSVEDFDIVKTIGIGCFGTVLLVRDETTLEYHAMKVFEKATIVEKSAVKQLLQEKTIMQCVRFPFTITLDFCCKDNLYIYLLVPYQVGGDLFSLLKKLGNFSEPLVQFYAAQVVLALEYLHHCNIIHRDVKPENIFINESGYIKLGDYGFCKIIKTRTWTLCGTPEYIAPEIIVSKGYTFAVDWWSLGVLVFEMCAGYPPFYSNDTIKLYEKILEGAYKPPQCMSPYCKSLVKGLLVVDPPRRLGSLKAGVYDIKGHTWFSECNWNSIMSQKMSSPYIPVYNNVGDMSDLCDNTGIKLKRASKCLYEKEFQKF